MISWASPATHVRCSKSDRRAERAGRQIQEQELRRDRAGQGHRRAREPGRRSRDQGQGAQELESRISSGRARRANPAPTMHRSGSGLERRRTDRMARSRRQGFASPKIARILAATMRCSSSRKSPDRHRAVRARLRPGRRSADRRPRSLLTTSSADGAACHRLHSSTSEAHGWRSRGRRVARFIPGISASRSNHVGNAGFPAAPFRVVIKLDEPLDRRQQADDLLLADLHPAADAHVGTDRLLTRRDQVATPQQQPRRLRAARPLPPEKATRSNPCVNVFAKAAPTGGTSAAASLKSGTVRSLPDPDPFLSLDLTQRLVPVQEKHHCRARVDRPVQLSPSLHPHQPGAGQRDLRLVARVVSLSG